MDPVHQKTYEGGCLIIPCRTQCRTLFLEIIVPCNHWGPLIDHNTGEPYPMAAAADFCLMDPIFPGSPGDSLLLKENDLTQLKRKGFCVSTYRSEKPQPTVPKEDKHKSSHAKEKALSSSCREEESHKTVQYLGHCFSCLVFSHNHQGITHEVICNHQHIFDTRWLVELHC